MKKARANTKKATKGHMIQKITGTKTERDSAGL